MPMPLDQAVSTLDRAGEVRAADDRFRERMRSVQQLLAEDLTHIERALAEASADCAAPADAAARHLIDRGGKRVRPLALLLSTACFGAVEPAACELAVVAELVHSATLLHDDVIDEGMVRRGAPTARRLWGNGMSVLAGDLLLVHAIDRTLTYFPAVLPELTDTLRQLVEGEVIQMRGRTELDVSEETYEQVLRGKTASLFVWAASVGAKIGGGSPADQQRLGEFGGHLGMAFQLIDDVLDYVGDQSGKTLLTDLCEGKLTLPLVLAVRQVPELLESVRRIHAGEHEPVARVSQVVRDCGACDEVRRRAAEFTERGVRALSSVRPSPACVLLQSVAEQLAKRAS